MYLILFLIVFLTFNNEIVAKASQEYEESTLDTKVTYDNFIRSLLNEKLTRSISKQYGKKLVGYESAVGDYIEIKQLSRETVTEKTKDVKYHVTFSIRPHVEENGKQITKGTDHIHFEILPDLLSEGDTNKGIRLIKYEQHK